MSVSEKNVISDAGTFTLVMLILWHCAAVFGWPNEIVEWKP